MHEEAIRKADVLIEALGYFRTFHGKFTGTLHQIVVQASPEKYADVDATAERSESARQ